MRGLSVIIPTLNRTSYVIDTLKDLVCQNFDLPFEIIVVDQSDKPDDVVLDFTKSNQEIKYYHITTFRGLPEARNYGASISRFDYLLYLDDDITCGAELFAQHCMSLDDEGISLVAGGITEKYNSNIDCAVGKFVKLSATPLRGFHKKTQMEVDHAGGGNFSLKKSVFNEVGGIDEQLTKGAALYEETDICLRVKRAGHIIYYNNKAHMWHLAAKTGGCREPNVHKYVYSLSRNRTIIIHRHLSWFYRRTAHLYLLKLVLAYMRGYGDSSLYKSYLKGKREGKLVALRPILNTSKH